MITVSLLGMDPYTAIDLTKTLQFKLADVYETAPEEIIFYAPQSFLIYSGREQGSVRLIVKVDAPHVLRQFEAQVSEVLVKALEEYAIHINIFFTYHDKDSEYNYIDHDYPLFLTDDNAAPTFDSEDGEEEEEDYWDDDEDEDDEDEDEDDDYEWEPEDDGYEVTSTRQDYEGHDIYHNFNDIFAKGVVKEENKRHHHDEIAEYGDEIAHEGCGCHHHHDDDEHECCHHHAETEECEGDDDECCCHHHHK